MRLRSRADIDRILANARDVCAHKKKRLTPLRELVLRIISAEERPYGAYEVLKTLPDDVVSKEPPTVYRTLEFWMNIGLVKRVNSTNSFLALDSEHPLGSTIFVCTKCKWASVFKSESTRIVTEELRVKGHMPELFTNEVHGLCRSCK